LIGLGEDCLVPPERIDRSASAAVGRTGATKKRTGNGKNDVRMQKGNGSSGRSGQNNRNGKPSAGNSKLKK
jgi:hypothetical protein